MALDNMSDGVGKKIVEALKMQDAPSDFAVEEDNWMDNSSTNLTEAVQIDEEPAIPVSAVSVEDAFAQSIANNLGVSSPAALIDDFEYPANVAVLKQLISKLPAGVSKQTGALIIKQTMEALGISMSSVLQEAKQVQDTLANNSKECQNNIVEYRKQISILESKSQQYQRQYVVMNDIINLFRQTGI